MKTELTMFSNRKLRALIIPLLFDQLLNVLVGMADTVMVSTVGEAAVSGVSLVDNLNMFFLMIFAGLATGGSIICAQMVGLKKYRQARLSGNQQLLVTGGISVLFLAVSLGFRSQLLVCIFGKVDGAVMQNAMDYFLFIACSLPFLAIHNGCGALFRAVGDSKTPMKVSMLMNGLNIAGNAFCLFVLHMGVFGVAVPTLVSRIVAAAVDVCVIRQEELPISMRRFTFKPDFPMIKRILSLAVPSSLESGIFQIGKILVLSLISSLGTVAITANAVANSILTFQTLTEDAMGIAMITVIGQCAGAGEQEQARGYTKRLMRDTYLMMWAVNIPIALCGSLVLNMYHLCAATAATTIKILYYNCLCGFTIWPAAFTLPNSIRASGNVFYTMAVSLFSMWVFRIGMSYILVKGFGMGLFAIYMSFGVDWLFRAVAFAWKAFKGKRKPAQIVSG